MTGIATPLDDKRLLGGVGASVRLTPSFRVGTSDLDVADSLVSVPGLREHGLEPVRLLLDEVMSRYSPRTAASSDSWLGPRLHSALRLSRREAANRSVWRFIGLWGADYVRWRFGPPPGEEDAEKAAKDERFVGPDTKQAFARLWWMVEVFRDGKNYEPAALALTNQDVINYFFRASIINHRPTALAALDVLPRSADGRSLPQGRHANALAKATNAAATTLVLDLIGPDVEPDAVARVRWEGGEADHDPQYYFDVLPEGPDDGEAPAASIEAMRVLLTDLLASAKIRGRDQSQEEEASEDDAE